MHPPFTVQQFFGVFRLYNTAVWPAQVLLLLLPALIRFFLIALRRPRSGAAVSTILAVLWLWVGIAYHWAFFAQINPVAVGFGALSIVGGLLFAWQGLFHRHLAISFARNRRTVLGGVLIVFALPSGAGLRRGHRHRLVRPAEAESFTFCVLGVRQRPGEKCS